MSTQNKSLLAKWIVIFAVAIAVQFIPASEVLTPALKVFFSITVFCIFMMVFGVLDTAVISLILMFGYAISGIAPLGTVLSSWENPVVWIILGCFILVNIVKRTTILDRIACWCVILTGGSYRGLIMGMILLGAVTNILIPGTLIGVMLLGLAYSVCEALDLGKSKAACGIMCAVLFGLFDSGNFIYTPGWISVLYGVIGGVMDISTAYSKYFIDNIIFIPLMFIQGFILSVVMKPEKEMNGKQFFIDKKNALGKMTVTDKKVFIVLLLFMVFLFTTQWTGIPMVYGFIVVPILFFLPGMDIAQKEDIQTANWSLLLFIVACMSIGTVGNSLGVGNLIQTVLLPLVENAGSTVVIMVIMLFTTISNFVLTPGAICSIFGLPLVGLAESLNISIYPLVYAVYQGSANIIMPHEIALTLALFGFGNVTMKDFMISWGVKMIFAFIFMLCLGIPYWKLIGLL